MAVSHTIFLGFISRWTVYRRDPVLCARNQIAQISVFPNDGYRGKAKDGTPGGGGRGVPILVEEGRAKKARRARLASRGPGVPFHRGPEVERRCAWLRLLRFRLRCVTGLCLISRVRLRKIPNPKQSSMIWRRRTIGVTKQVPCRCPKRSFGHRQGARNQER